MVGEIYSADDTGTVVNTIKTTCKQDMMFLIYMNARLGSIDTYSVGRHNCRRYSQYEFRDAPSTWGHPNLSNLQSYEDELENVAVAYCANHKCFWHSLFVR